MNACCRCAAAHGLSATGTSAFHPPRQPPHVLVYLRGGADTILSPLANLSRSTRGRSSSTLRSLKGAVPIGLRAGAVSADRRYALPCSRSPPCVLLVRPQPRGRGAAVARGACSCEGPAGDGAGAGMEQLLSWARGAVAGGKRAAGAARGRVVPGFLATQRWVAPAGVALAEPAAARCARERRDAGGLRHARMDLDRWLLMIFEVAGSVLSRPVLRAAGDRLRGRLKGALAQLRPFALARVRQQAAVGVLADAGADEDFCSLVAAITHLAAVADPARTGALPPDQRLCRCINTRRLDNGGPAIWATAPPSGSKKTVF